MDELLELAVKSGAYMYFDSGVTFLQSDLAAFAAALRAQERERCAAVCDTFAAPMFVEATSQDKAPYAAMLTEAMRHGLYAPLAAAIRALE